MRLWKKISIYFIYPACMLAVGLAAGLGVQEFFYPNRFPPAGEQAEEQELREGAQREETARDGGKPVEAAGGMTDGAAWQINQAQELADGQQVYVPSKEEASEAGTGPGLAGQASDGKVNINTATKEELMTLSGIGEARAEAILKYREEKGGFQSTEELKEIDGIKDGIFGKIEDQIKI